MTDKPKRPRDANQLARLVVIVGQRKAVAIAVKNVSGRRRWSKLDEWLGRPPAAARHIME